MKKPPAPPAATPKLAADYPKISTRRALLEACEKIAAPKKVATR